MSVSGGKADVNRAHRSRLFVTQICRQQRSFVATRYVSGAKFRPRLGLLNQLDKLGQLWRGIVGAIAHDDRRRDIRFIERKVLNVMATEPAYGGWHESDTYIGRYQT